LVRDGLSIGLALVVFLLKLVAHFAIILVELLLLEVTPVLINFGIDGFLARFESLLSLTFVQHVGVKQLALERLNHVLLVVQMSIGTLDLLSAKLVLILLLFSVNLTSSNLFFLELFDAIFFALVS